MTDIEKIRAVIERNKWRPIEEAPKDGTVVLALCAAECFPQAIKYVVYEEWSGWIYSDEMLIDHVPAPTHFRPLPDDTLARMAEVMLAELIEANTRVYALTNCTLVSADNAIAECARIAEEANGQG